VSGAVSAAARASATAAVVLSVKEVPELTAATSVALLQ
jgi:hypothetical protein